MSRRVRQHPPAARRLVIGLGGTAQQQRRLRLVEVVHLEVEVSLLRLLLAGPARALVAVHTLEAEEESAGATEAAKSLSEPPSSASPVASA